MPTKSIHIRFDHETLRHMIDALRSKQIPLPPSVHQVVKVCALSGVTSMLNTARWPYETPSYESSGILTDLLSSGQAVSALQSALQSYEHTATSMASPGLQAIRQINPDKFLEGLSETEQEHAQKMINLLCSGDLEPADLIDPLSANPVLGQRILKDLYYNILSEDIQQLLAKETSNDN